ncbi:hypothetical protein HN419_07175 [Candidatus Woesearchaeota archaeon]|jgi:hypothetical protein|nr:hypothetical protein [Candidatus Woesearchaeota archaeon]MBT4717440.1 hypothetical protein [Candidatus Woesearchaeota archaeon]MBT7105943.1 hypothetical protein [Candidatus Woesearchaeota archaeon]MBT7930452.1 hypothetical protein [Candidatus Woesearchaeota archaeon]
MVAQDQKEVVRVKELLYIFLTILIIIAILFGVLVLYDKARDIFQGSEQENSADSESGKAFPDEKAKEYYDKESKETFYYDEKSGLYYNKEGKSIDIEDIKQQLVETEGEVLGTTTTSTPGTTDTPGTAAASTLGAPSNPDTPGTTDTPEATPPGPDTPETSDAPGTHEDPLPDTPAPDADPEPGVSAEETPDTETECTDSIDNDEDGLLDTIDDDCRGQYCDTGKVWIWSHIAGEDYDTAPPENEDEERRIGCCEVNECITASGTCYPFDMTLSPGWICGSFNRWKECTSSKINSVSDGGDYLCTGSQWTSYEDTETQCDDNLDNDNDGEIDEIDSDCRGTQCSKTGKTWIWSYLPGQNQDLPPPATGSDRRIGCCSNDECVNIDGECVDYDTEYSDTYICGNNNNWDVCSIKTPNKDSDGGSFVCRGNPARWGVQEQFFETSCDDNFDNDGDGGADEYDGDCVGETCAPGKVWTWSYLFRYNPSYNQWWQDSGEGDSGTSYQMSTLTRHYYPPQESGGDRRIACCEPDECVNLDGECKPAFSTYFDNPSWLCRDYSKGNHWFKCDLGSNTETFEGQRGSFDATAHCVSNTWGTETEWEFGLAMP